jgi:urease accessory protein
MSQMQFFQFRAISKLQRRQFGAIALLFLISLLSTLSGVPTQHTISNCWEGLLWGLAHPVINLAHLVTIISVGLLSTRVTRGAILPVAFVLATISGTDIHLFQVYLPGPEIAIALAIIAFSAILVMPNRPNSLLLLLLCAIAGLFHGFTYGESIIDTEIIPAIAYVLGVTLTQYVVAVSAKVIIQTSGIRVINQNLLHKIRFIGFAFCAIGIAFASESLM